MQATGGRLVVVALFSRMTCVLTSSVLTSSVFCYDFTRLHAAIGVEFIDRLSAAHLTTMQTQIHSTVLTAIFRCKYVLVSRLPKLPFLSPFIPMSGILCVLSVSFDHWLCKVLLQSITLSVTLISTFIIIIIIFSNGLVGWLVLNGTFSTNRLYRAISAQEINPVTIRTLDKWPNRLSKPGLSVWYAGYNSVTSRWMHFATPRRADILVCKQLLTVLLPRWVHPINQSINQSEFFRVA